MGKIIKICDMLAERAGGRLSGELHLPGGLESSVVRQLIVQRLEKLSAGNGSSGLRPEALSADREIAFLEEIRDRLNNE